jgi:predicted ATP-dependent endonuclease of OLD family
MTAHIDGSEPTLVLIDEPETHLHPCTCPLG